MMVLIQIVIQLKTPNRCDVKYDDVGYNEHDRLQ